jgi:pyridoxal phosphate enzyme (YggS family)
VIEPDIAVRWRDVRARVDAACARAGRDPAEVTVVAVAKTQPVERVREAVAAGAVDIGENYAQELATKRAEVAGARWHFIGRLQRNKVKLVAGQVALVHAVDSADLAAELSKRTPDGAVQRVLIAVNVAGEATKGGVAPADAPALAHAIADLPRLALDGLMTMPPPDVDPRPAFEGLRRLRDDLAAGCGAGLPVLSMGMSSDFEVAIGCGATHVRIGTAIFGARA